MSDETCKWCRGLKRIVRDYEENGQITAYTYDCPRCCDASLRQAQDRAERAELEAKDAKKRMWAIGHEADALQDRIAVLERALLASELELAQARRLASPPPLTGTPAEPVYSKRDVEAITSLAVAAAQSRPAGTPAPPADCRRCGGAGIVLCHCSNCVSLQDEFKARLNCAVCR